MNLLEALRFAKAAQDDASKAPPNFLPDIWPHYLHVLEHGGAGMSYWLEANEILAVATIAKVPLALLEKHEDGFYYSASNIVELSEDGRVQPILVSVRANRTERVESHFERVMYTEELKDTDALRLRYAQRQQTERTTMLEEEELSRRFAQQLERERANMQVEDARCRE